MPGREEPGNPVEGGAEVVAVALLGRAGVDANPNAQRPDLAPRLG
jgi:hypothetical protein